MTSILIPCVLLSIVFILVAIFFLNIFRIGNILAIIGARKFNNNAILKLVNVTVIFKSVFNSSFITALILFKAINPNIRAKINAGIEKQIH